jgi:Tol biopolymer transport system component
VVLLGALAGIGVTATPAEAATVGDAILVSHLPLGPATMGEDSSEQPVVSADGRYVAFRSAAADLVAGQSTNASSNVFLFDRVTGAVRLVSHVPGNATTSGNGASGDPAISADGRYITFETNATNLVSGHTDTNGGFEIMLFDRDAPAASAVTLVTHIPSSATTSPDLGGIDPVISGDGRYVAFGSSASNLVTGAIGGQNVYLFDRDAAPASALTLVSHVAGSATTSAGGSDGQVISGDGNYVAFASSATNLVTGSDTNTADDIFLFERASGEVTLVSHSSASLTIAANNANEAPVISANGRYVAWRSSATNLVAGQNVTGHNNIFLFDWAGGAVTLVSHVQGSATTTGNNTSIDPAISADGRFVVFESRATNLGQTTDTNGTDDIFLFDRDAAPGTALTLVTHVPASATSTGGNAGQDPAISADGRYVAFASSATDLVVGTITNTNVYLFDRLAPAATALSLVSHTPGIATTSANNHSFTPELSADGSFVAYPSRATNLVTGQADANGGGDIFLFDRASGANVAVSHVPGLTTTADAVSRQPAVSADGRWVAFTSAGDDVVAGQTASPATNVFLFDRETGVVRLVSHTPGSTSITGNSDSGDPVISADGRYTAFETSATDLVPGQTDTNEGSEIVLFDRDAPAATALTLVSHIPSSATTSGNAGGLDPGISDDGRYVTFGSAATNLVPGTITNSNIYLFDRDAPAASALTLVSHVPGNATTSANGSSAEQVISGDGNYVAFRSSGSNLVTGQTDGSGTGDIFLFTRAGGAVTLVSHAHTALTTTGEDSSEQPVISADGRYVAFRSAAIDLVAGQTTTGNNSVFLFDRMDGAVTLVSHVPGSTTTTGNDRSGDPAISADGRWVVFESAATDLGQTDNNAANFEIFLFDRDAPAGTALTLVTHVPSSAISTGDVGGLDPVISDDGRYVAFDSGASDLVTGTIAGTNVYLFDRLAPTASALTLVSHVAGNATTSAGGSNGSAISADGNYVAFQSVATNLVTGQNDVNSVDDVFLVGQIAIEPPKASPTITTDASPGNLVGAPVRDTATLAGGNSPTGNVTFRLFSDASCATEVFTSTNNLSGLSATSDWFIPASAGTYRWTAVYNGDANNNSATSPCNAPNESVTLTAFQAPAYTQTVNGDVAGPLTVTSGQSVLINAGARVLGPVTVNPGGALTVVNARISRGVVVDNPSFLSVCGSEISGPPPAQALGVSNATVPIRIGDPATGCAGNRFTGQVILTANLGVTFGSNQVSHNATINNGGPAATVIKANNVFGTLTCTGNNPAPTNAGQANTAAAKTGQCAGL